MQASRAQLNWIEFKTVVRREVSRFMRIWVQTIIPPIITTALYFIIFGNLIGTHIPNMDGYRYIDFIVPGLIMMSVINSSYVNVVSSFYSAKFQRHIEELLVSPTPNLLILLGYLSGGVLRGLIVGGIVVLVSSRFTELHLLHPWFTLLVVLLTATLFALGGFINAIFARKFDDVSLVPTFLLQPLTYLGGVFYSISLLPEFWQKVSLANPILYVINAFRYGLLGVSDININLALAIIILVTGVLFFVAWYLLDRGIGLRS